MAEGAGLLNQYTGNRIEGSNPSPSANFSYLTEIYQSNFGVAAGPPAFCALSQAMIGYSEPETGVRERFGGLSAGYLCGPKNRFRFAAL